ncbi:MAG: membrane-associated phospholipid phosphatase [Maribacter sp.]|jgi:membrane-associated phospholipid phosphatase
MKSGENFYAYKFKEWMRDFTSLASPLILVFVPFAILGPSKEYYILLGALAVNEVLGSIIKIVFPKARPTGQKYSNTMEKIDAGSFPSLHAARITVVYLTLFFLAELVVMKVLFLLVIAIVCCSRILLKKHFWTDVAGGLVMGGIVGLLACWQMGVLG